MKVLEKIKKNILILIYILNHKLNLFSFVKKFINGLKVVRNNENKLEFPFIKKNIHRSVQILPYHRVNDDNDIFFPGLPIKMFKEQIQYLADYYNVVPLDCAIEMLKKDDVCENCAVLTFDDGYMDNYTNAYPILKDLSMPATIFIATNPTTFGTHLWHDLVFEAFRKTEVNYLKIYTDKYFISNIGTVEKKVISLNYILTYIRTLNSFERNEFINRLYDCLEIAKKSSCNNLMLDWVQIKEMKKNGINFGCHTKSHPILSIISKEDAKKEIFESKTILESKLEQSIHTFAYPNGSANDYSRQTIEIIKDAGFKCAVTTIYGTNSHGIDMYQLKRGGPLEAKLPIFASRLAVDKLIY